MRKTAFSLLALCASAISAHAQETLTVGCTFDLECYETEPCQMSAYGMDLTISGDEEPWAVLAETDAETMSGEAYELGTTLMVRLGSELGPVMITIDADGMARQSIHTVGLLSMINYTGGCGVID